MDSLSSAPAQAHEALVLGPWRHQVGGPPRTGRAATTSAAFIPQAILAWCWLSPRSLAQTWRNRARAQGPALSSPATACLPSSTPGTSQLFSDRPFPATVGGSSIPPPRGESPWRSISSWLGEKNRCLPLTRLNPARCLKRRCAETQMQRLNRTVGVEPHPEGGFFYRERHRSSLKRAAADGKRTCGPSP